jgi:hypothetical protein
VTDLKLMGKVFAQVVDEGVAGMAGGHHQMTG